MEQKDDIVYFELNNWMRGKDYPNDEPFISWLSNELSLKFNNEDWVKENKLCVVRARIDMSQNYLITAKKSWVEENCPRLLTDYTEFLRYPDPDELADGEIIVYSKNAEDHFLEYDEKNIGITEGCGDDDDEDYYEEDDEDDDFDGDFGDLDSIGNEQ